MVAEKFSPGKELQVEFGAYSLSLQFWKWMLSSSSSKDQKVREKGEKGSDVSLTPMDFI